MDSFPVTVVNVPILKPHLFVPYPNNRKGFVHTLGYIRGGVHPGQWPFSFRTVHTDTDTHLLREV